jgi:G3E family GTPase
LSCVPVSVLTGFLGSGKTTLLRSLLAHPDMRDTAVLVNEFGEAGLDHLLVREVTEDVVLLGSGCLCCAVRDDLVSTLTDLDALRKSGAAPGFSRVVIETTGLADPAPIVHTLIGERRLRNDYRLTGLVATIDGVLGDSELDVHLEAVKQAAMADRLVVTKCDLAPASRIETLRARLSRLNPAARMFRSSLGNFPGPSLLFDPPPVHAGFEDLDRTIGAGSSNTAWRDASSHGPHDERIGTFVIRMRQPVAWDSFVEWLELLLSSRGENLLRVKGLLNVAGNPRPVVIQGVQHMFYPPEELAAWPGADRRSCLVFITRDFTRRAVETSLKQVLGEAFVSV